MKTGRPPKISDEEWLELLPEIEQLARNGLTYAQIADCLGIGYSAFFDAKSKIPQISTTLKKGRAIAISTIANTLYTKALSGDVACIIFYLKSRAGWSDRIAENTLRDAKLQASKLYDMSRAILEVASDSQEVRQIKSLVSGTIDTILIESGKDAIAKLISGESDLEVELVE